MSTESVSSQKSRGLRNRRPRVSPPTEPRGTPASGRITALLIGQGTGYIQQEQGSKVFFHRKDVEEGTSINDLAVGDAVDFDLIEDAVSGLRALRVRRPASR